MGQFSDPAQAETCWALPAPRMFLAALTSCGRSNHTFDIGTRPGFAGSLWRHARMTSSAVRCGGGRRRSVHDQRLALCTRASPLPPSTRHRESIGRGRLCQRLRSEEILLPSGLGFGTDHSQQGERPALIEIRDRSLLPGPRTSALFEGGVVKLALEYRQSLEGAPLAASRLEEIAIRAALSHRVEGIDGV